MINSTANINKNKCPLCRAKIEVNFNLKENKELKKLKNIVKKTYNFKSKSKKSIRIHSKINNYNNSNEQIDLT